MSHPRIYLSVPHMSGEEERYVADAFRSNWLSTVGPNIDGLEHDVCCKHLFAVALAHATRRRHRPCACVDGWMYLGYEEDGVERTEAVPCRRCNA